MTHADLFLVDYPVSAYRLFTLTKAWERRVAAMLILKRQAEESDTTVPAGLAADLLVECLQGLIDEVTALMAEAKPSAVQSSN